MLDYETTDRNKQIEVLRDIAADIVFSSDDLSCPAADRVAYYVANVEMPSWFDKHDEALLVELVEA